MMKWTLLIKTLPFVVLMIILALIRDQVLHIKGIIEFSDVTPLLSVVALIIGFMMAGVLSDYKESEKIPGEIATILETINDTIQVVIALAKDADISDFESKYHHLVTTVEDWLVRGVAVDQCYASLENFQPVIRAMHQLAGVNYTIRCLGEVHNLRRLITRVDVIARTSFIPAGYALLDLLVGSTLILLLISNYKTVMAEYVLIALLSLIYIFLIRLIRDVDNPFQFSADNQTGSVEVDTYPLQEYRQRLEAARK